MLRASLFGTPSFEWNGAAFVLDVPSECIVLFAMLLLARPEGRVSRSAAAASLWAREDPRDAAASLARSLAALTEALPPDAEYVCSDSESLWTPAGAPLWCDIIAFEDGPHHLYGNDLLEGYTNDWVREQRRRLARLAVRGLLDRADDLFAAGDDAGAIACGRFAMEIDEHEVARIDRERKIGGDVST